MARKPFPAALTVCGAVFVCAAALYLTTTARVPAVGDWGDFIACASVLGISHPTGYPVFLQILGLPLLLLPRGATATAADLTNALLVAAAPALLALWAFRRSGEERFAGADAAFAVALGVLAAATPALWSEATSVEIYGVALAMVLGVLCLIEAAERRKDDRFLYAAAFVTGLTEGTHLTAFIFALLLIVAGIFGRRRSAKRALVAGAAVALGVSAVLYIPIRASTPTPLKWGWAGVNDISVAFDHLAGRKIPYAFRWPSWLLLRYRLEDLAAAAWQNGGPIFFLAPVGLWVIGKRFRSAALGVAALLAAGFSFLILYDLPDRIPTSYRLAFLVIGVACGITAALALARITTSRAGRWTITGVAAVAAVVAAAGGWPRQKRDGAFAAYISKAVAAPLAYRATFFSGDITPTFLFWVRRHTLLQRPDVEFFNLNDGRWGADKLDEKAAALVGERPVFADYFFVNQAPRRDLFYRRGIPNGVVVRITRDETAATQPSLFTAAALKEANRYLARGAPGRNTDRWTAEYAASVFENLAFFHKYRGETAAAGFYFKRGATLAPAQPIPQVNLAAWYWRAGDYEGVRRAARAALAADREAYNAHAYLALGDQAEGDLDGALAHARAAAALKPRDGKIRRLVAMVYLSRKDYARAQREMERMVAARYYDADAVLTLARLYRQQGREEDAFNLLAKAAGASGEPRLLNAYAEALARRGRYEEAQEIMARITPPVTTGGR